MATSSGTVTMTATFSDPVSHKATRITTAITATAATSVQPDKRITKPDDSRQDARLVVFVDSSESARFFEAFFILVRLSQMWCLLGCFCTDPRRRAR
jgi:hypothetical protein